MDDSTDFNEGEYDEITVQIINILKNIQKLNILIKKGFKFFLTEDYDYN
ncbi:hypothetical protein [Methanobacterium ferruginis]|nr:hypothetical protein [Methanobacterium ferruginis]BDZ68755.1 hypothetical protein GCM10025860_22030 [Methanobacterium ferruginis]